MDMSCSLDDFGIDKSRQDHTWPIYSHLFAIDHEG